MPSIYGYSGKGSRSSCFDVLVSLDKIIVTMYQLTCLENCISNKQDFALSDVIGSHDENCNDFRPTL